MRNRTGFLAIGLAILVAAVAAPVHASGVLDPPEAGELLPPHIGAVLRRFEAPATPWGAGHRGIDLAVEAGVTVLVAPIAGRVTTGLTPGNRFVTIERAEPALRVTLSYLSQALVTGGTQVEAGDPVAIAGPGHGDGEVADEHVHLSVRLPDLTDPSGWRYTDPLPDLRKYLRRVRRPVTRLDHNLS